MAKKIVKIVYTEDCLSCGHRSAIQPYMKEPYKCYADPEKRSVEDYSWGEIPDWCPLEDADAEV